MITIKSKSQIQKLRDAGRIVAQTHQLLKEHIKEGITTYELDYLAEKYNVELYLHLKAMEDLKAVYVPH